MTCSTCKFYDGRWDGGERGLCRINPPVPRGDSLGWPIVRGDSDWCGQHTDLKRVDPGGVR